MQALVGCGKRVQEGDSLREIAPIGSLKARLFLKEKPMIQWVLDVLADVSSLRTLFLIGYEGPFLHCKGKQMIYLEDQGGIVDNLAFGIQKALERDPHSERLLWISSDIPCVRSEMIEWFIEQTHLSNRDIYYQIIQRSVMERCFPKSQRTYFKLKNKTVCFADVNALNPQRIHFRHIALCKQIEKYRKRPLHIAKLFGLSSVLKFIFRMGGEEEISRVLKRKFGVDLHLIDSPYAEMGFDIDKIEDYNLFYSSY